jgi:hypothetical protein
MTSGNINNGRKTEIWGGSGGEGEERGILNRQFT